MEFDARRAGKDSAGWNLLMVAGLNGKVRRVEFPYLRTSCGPA